MVLVQAGKNKTFSELLSALDTRYGVAAPKFVIKARLRNIYQGEDQSVQAFADELNSAVAGKPGMKTQNRPLCWNRPERVDRLHAGRGAAHRPRIGLVEEDRLAAAHARCGVRPVAPEDELLVRPQIDGTALLGDVGDQRREQLEQRGVTERCLASIRGVVGLERAQARGEQAGVEASTQRRFVHLLADEDELLNAVAEAGMPARLLVRPLCSP